MSDNESPSSSVATPTSTSPSKQFTRHPLWISLIILFWYAISNGIILSTKWLFNSHFPYPLTVTAYSNGVAGIWAAACTIIADRFFGIKREVLTHELITNYVLPIGLLTALEIGCSNLALKILTVSFGTILKGVAPIFQFTWCLLLGLEAFSWRVGASLLLIAVGIALASFGEGQEFELLGFLLQLSGTAMGGLRWALIHKILQTGDDYDSSSPDDDNSDNQGGGGIAAANKPPALSTLSATLYTTPLTSLFVLPFALALENAHINGGGDVVDHDDDMTNATTYSSFSNSTQSEWRHLGGDADAHTITIVVLTMTLIATLVFILLMSEYWLVKVTSSLGLSVAGTLKELLTIGGGIFFFSERIDLLNVVGFVTCQVGIMLYVVLRTPDEVTRSYDPVVMGVAETQMEAVNTELTTPFHDEGGMEEESNGFVHEDDRRVII